MGTGDLTFEQKAELVRLAKELRESTPMGVVALLELRNLLANLFPDFAEVRDEDIDKSIREYAESLAAKPELLEDRDLGPPY